MKVLIACEESQTVCKAFRDLGYEAFSCDLQECSGGFPEWHIWDDVLKIINGKCSFITMDGALHEVVKWDLIIAHPPCTYLTLSGNRWFDINKYGDAAKQRYKDRYQAIVFFMQMMDANCDRVAVENPIGIMSGAYRKPDQIIHPWMFGDNYAKSTCIWVKGLKPLVPVISTKPELEWFEWETKNGQKKRQPKWYADAWSLSPKERARVRSKTFPGIAKAMAEQWGGILKNG